MNLVRQGFSKLSSKRRTYRQTDKQTDRDDRSYTPRRFAGGHWSARALGQCSWPLPGWTCWIQSPYLDSVPRFHIRMASKM